MHPNDSKLVVRELSELLNTLDISRAEIADGTMRVDVSLQVEGDKFSGPTVDIKNLSSPRNLERAVEFEYLRHVDMLSQGDIPLPETRRFDEQSGRTEKIRLKEQEPDYRYF